MIYLFIPAKTKETRKYPRFTELHWKEIRNTIVIRTELCMTKTYTNMEIHSYIVVHDKTYNNMNITHNRVNQLITYNIPKQITELNQLVNDEVHS